MTENELRRRRLISAKQSEESIAKIEGQGSYKLAFADHDFLLSDDLRAVRLQLEYLKPQLTLEKHNVDATIVVFGSARFLPPEQAQHDVGVAEQALEKDPDNDTLMGNLKRAKRALKNSAYYQQAMDFARIATEHNLCHDDENLMIVSGGGPGIMEAANRGAMEAGGHSIGLNIVLPHEQRPNPYITPEYCFQFHYFAIRKMHFLQRARALVAFPGGFGTLDELFETLTLVQTKKSEPVPIVLVGKEFWQRLIDFDLLVEEGTISEHDLALFEIVDTAEEAWQAICHCYDLKNGSRHIR
ncbi:TIGR00730 family Rossman fold protein [Idiomarina piscisalsi]|uniref:Cytokinin riboside 5'-monophosphate phosphoribohydrolase n=1 Tax=Idiomarina piscisalsi TaxID=1096243 RepID=A0ABM6LQP6_9GAMM|nr:TIGR00730 family Rossman fold protein [Idiomarina piscisalsi]ASG64829.1 Rossman fold protein, TIGR00730 family [Idiomarina piscisalsi]MTJ00963.1 TIGR00730 family Rossman fold protein [Idiomarina piscisalsi]